MSLIVFEFRGLVQGIKSMGGSFVDLTARWLFLIGNSLALLGIVKPNKSVRGVPRNIGYIKMAGIKR